MDWHEDTNWWYYRGWPKYRVELTLPLNIVGGTKSDLVVLIQRDRTQCDYNHYTLDRNEKVWWHMELVTFRLKQKSMIWLWGKRNPIVWNNADRCHVQGWKILDLLISFFPHHAWWVPLCFLMGLRRITDSWYSSPSVSLSSYF
jgi:hypothetical protein